MFKIKTKRRNWDLLNSTLVLDANYDSKIYMTGLEHSHNNYSTLTLFSLRLNKRNCIVF